jgi:ABC-type multidrug transport system ATPase subunit
MSASQGTAFINGFEINKNRFNARKNLSLCPQNNHLAEYLTVFQTFELFSRLRGLENDSLQIKQIIQIFKLEDHSKKLIKHLR